MFLALVLFVIVAAGSFVAIKKINDEKKLPREELGQGDEDIDDDEFDDEFVFDAEADRRLSRLLGMPEPEPEIDNEPFSVGELTPRKPVRLCKTLPPVVVASVPRITPRI